MNQNGIGRSVLKQIKLFAVCLFVPVLLAVPCLAANSVENIPTTNYYFRSNSNGKKAVTDMPVFEVTGIIDGKSTGNADFGGISDMYAAQDGLLYALNAQKGIIFVLNGDFSVNRVIDRFTHNGQEISFSDPQGIFVEQDGSLIIADTENKRLVFSDKNGNVSNILAAPQGELIPDDLQFFPIKCVRDKKGFLYILSRGSYYGALTYDENGGFCGFYGANNVVANPIEKLERIFEKIFSTKESAKYKVQKLPFQFADLCIDSDDMLYTVSPNMKSRVGQIRKLSPTGENILYFTDSAGSENSDSVNFGEETLYKDISESGHSQEFNSIDVDENGNIFALDKVYGKIYVYDSECNSITVFGGGLGTGNKKGTFQTPSSVAAFDGKLLVADDTKNTVTVFSKTAYGEQIFKANALSLGGEYESAAEYWKKALTYSDNFQLAYHRMAQSELSAEKYREALEYAKTADDQVTYAAAFGELYNRFVNENFRWILLLAVVLIAAVITAIVFIKKKNIRLISNEGLRTSLNSPVHPFISFYDMRYKKRITWWIPVTVIVMFYIITVGKSLFGGFMYEILPDDFNALPKLGGTVGLTVLFVIVNWAIASLFEGKATFKEVLNIAGCALIPQLLSGLLYIGLSHFTVPGSTAIPAVTAICWLWSAVILIVGLISLQEFGFGKNLFVLLLTVIGIVFIIFILFMVMTFFQNFVSFVVSLIREVLLR